jgi:hypothetical protein
LKNPYIMRNGTEASTNAISLPMIEDNAISRLRYSETSDGIMPNTIKRCHRLNFSKSLYGYCRWW